MGDFGSFWVVLGRFGCFLGGFGSLELLFWVVLGHFVCCFGSFLMVLGGFGSFWVVLAGFGCFFVSFCVVLDSFGLF